MTPELSHFLVLGAILFAISVVGIFLNRRNLIVLLMAIELMLLAVNMNFIAFSHFLGNTAGGFGRARCRSGRPSSFSLSPRLSPRATPDQRGPRRPPFVGQMLPPMRKATGCRGD